MLANFSTFSEPLKSLEHFGFCKLEGVLNPELCGRLVESLDQIEAEQDRLQIPVGDETRAMVWNMHITHPELFMDKIHVPEVMKIMRHVLREPTILSSFGAIRNRNRTEVINVHIDSRAPESDWRQTSSALAIFCLNEFNQESGSTYLWPQSHKSGSHPKEIYPPGTALPGAIQVNGKVGDVIIFLGQTWHDVAPNLNGKKRWGMLAFYSRWWVKPTTDHTQISPELFSTLTPEQKILLGFTSRPPTPDNKFFRGNTIVNIEQLPRDYNEAMKF